jgi:hypothetical protein
VPLNADDFRQLFHLSFGDVDISRDGQRAIIKRVHELNADKATRSLHVVKE